MPDNIGDLAGGTNGYINTWMLIGLTSHFYIRKYKAGWFRKYNVSVFFSFLFLSFVIDYTLL